MTRPRDPERHMHDRFRLLAAAAVDSWIHPDDAAELEAHLATCAPCRADQRAMVADHAWLATPSRIAPPSARVRAAVLDAARAPRVPQIGQAPRPWSALLAAGLVLAVIGGGILLASIDHIPESGAGPTPTPTASAGSSTSRPGETSMPARGCAPIPADLSARWHFDSPSEHLTGQPITFIGAFAYADGVAGSALRLDGGSNAASAQAPANLDFGTGDFTISLWVRFASTAGEQVLLERYREVPLEGWTLTKLESGELRFAVDTDQGGFDSDSTGVDLGFGAWHHVAVRRAGTAFTIAVDGEQAAVGDLGSGVRADLSTELPLLFGRRGDDRLYAFDGDMDEVLFWTGRALTDDEIEDLHQAGQQGFCEAAAGAGYEGRWTSMDCATRGERIDCGVWGDGNSVQLEIGPGEHPAAVFTDETVPGCGEGGASGSRAASGSGEFDGVYLWVTFSTVDCMQPSESWTNPMQLYRGPGDPAIWFDPDGDNWGLLYRPA